MEPITWVDLVIAQTEDAAASEGGHGVMSLLSEATGVVLLVLIGLILASITCWFIIGYKALVLRRAGSQTRKFLDAFWKSKRLDSIFQVAEGLNHSPVSQVFIAGYVELRKIKSAEAAEGDTMRMQLGGIENVERSLRRAMSTEVTILERLVPFLATVGSAAPFVGLFGTVWGIMLAFMEISEAGQAGIDVVAGPIAEALIATAIGLMAAIPAVVAYNYFNTRIHSLEVDMENFSNDFLNIMKRHFLK